MSDVNVGRLRGTIELEDKFQNVLNRFESSVAKSARAVGQSLKDTGSALLPISAALGAMGAGAATIFADFERGMNRVNAITNASTEELKKMTDQALFLGATTQYTARDAADAMGFLALAGFKVNEIMGAMPSVLQLASSAQMSIADAANITSNILRGYGMEVENLGHANDVLVKAFTSTNTDLLQLGEAFKYVGPVAKNAGVQFEETAAALGLISNAGIQSSMAGTGLRRIISELLNPSTEAQKVMERLGITIRDNGGKLLPLNNILDQFKKSTDIATDSMVIFGDRGGPAFQALVMAGGDALRGLTGKLEDSVGVAQRVGGAQMQGLKGKWFEMVSAMEGAMIALGRAMSPALQPLMDMVTKASNWVQNSLIPAFQALPSPVQVFIGSLFGVLAVAGPLLIALGGLVTALAAMVGMAANGVSAMMRLATSFAATGTTAAAATGPVTALAAAQARATVASSMTTSSATFMTSAMTGSAKALQTAAAAATPVASQFSAAALGAGALTAAAVAAGAAIGTQLGGALLRHGDELRGISDEYTRAAQETGLLRGAWILLGDAASGLANYLFNQAAAWVELGMAAVEWVTQSSFMKGFFDELRTQLTDVGTAAKWAWDQMAESASLAGDVIYEAGLKMYSQAEGADVAAKRANDLATASKIAGYSVKDWDTALLLVNSNLTSLPPNLAKNDAAVKSMMQTYQLATRDFLNMNKVLEEALKKGGATATPPKPPKPPGPSQDEIDKLKKFQEEVQRLRDEFSGAAAGDEMKKLAAAFPDLHAVAAPMLDDLRDKVQELVEEGAKLPKVFEPLINNLPAAKKFNLGNGIQPPMGPFLPELPTINKAWIKQVYEIEELYKVIDRTTGLWTRYPDVVENELGDATNGVKQHAQDIQSEFSKAFESLPQTILSAIQGGGNVGKAVGASLLGGIGQDLGKKLSEHIGGTLGKALGGLAGPLGSLAGSILGGFADKVFGKLFKSEEKKVNDLRDAFLSAHGGWQAFQKELAGASNQDLLKKIFNAKTVKDFEAAVKEAEAALNLHGEAEQKLQAAIDKYGFSIEELGPKFQQQKLDEMAASLLEDYKLLTASGIEQSTVISKMGPAFQDYVNTAMSAGSAIPEAFRPMVEQLIASGQLLDENGNAFTSLEESGITFTETLSEGLSRLIDKIDQLVAALTGAGSAASRISIPGTGGDGAGVIPGKYTPENLPQYEDGTNGFVNFGSGTPAMLHNWEAVVPKEKADQFMRGYGGPSVSVNYSPSLVVQGAGNQEEILRVVNDGLRNDREGLESRVRDLVQRYAQ